MTSPRGKLNRTDAKKIGKGALISFGGALIAIGAAAVAVWVNAVSPSVMGDMAAGAVVAAACAVLLNAARKLISGK